MSSPKPRKRVALVTAYRAGLLLMGKRTDTGRWTLPAGSIEDGESPADGARRELLEETGLSPTGNLKQIDERTAGQLTLYTFECEVEGVPTGKHDPDEECQLWAWFDVSEGIPKAVAENMAGPKDPDDNVAADVLGLAKMAIADIPKGKKVGRAINDPMMGKMTSYDYSHVLPSEARAQGYKVTVRHNFAPDKGDRHALESLLSDPNGNRAGAVRAVSGRGQGIRPHSEIDDAHRGKGLGTALYEALYAHALQSGIRYVDGGAHSPEAHRVHRALARKHGLEYRGEDTLDEERGRYGGYRYDLKSELPMTKAELDAVELEKAAGYDASGNPIQGGPVDTDYSHLLSPEERTQGYELRVRERSPHVNARGRRGGYGASAELLHPDAGDPSGHGLPKGLVSSRGFFVRPEDRPRNHIHPDTQYPMEQWRVEHHQLPERRTHPTWPQLGDPDFPHAHMEPRLLQAIQAHRWNSRPLEARVKDLQAEHAQEQDPARKDRLAQQLVNADHELESGQPMAGLPPVRKAEEEQHPIATQHHDIGPAWDYSHHLSAEDKAKGHRLLGFERDTLGNGQKNPYIAWQSPGYEPGALRANAVQGSMHAERAGSGHAFVRSGSLRSVPPAIDSAMSRALSQHIDLQKPLAAQERVRRAQIEQGYGAPGPDPGGMLNGPLTSERRTLENTPTNQAAPSQPAQEPESPQVRRVHNRFVGTKATEKTSRLGASTRKMAERQAFDYSHQLPPEAQAKGFKITVYHHPNWKPNEAVDAGGWAGPAIHAPATPLVEVTQNGEQRDPREYTLHESKRRAMNEHVQNAKRTVKTGTPQFGQSQVPFLDTLELPPEGERAQLLEIDQPKRGRQKAKPAVPAASTRIAPDVSEGAQPLEVPPHREQSNDERHLLWDYSHMLSPEDRAAGRRIEIRHTPGRFDDYMHGSFFDPRDPTASLSTWSYPDTDPKTPGVALGGPETPDAQARAEKLKTAIGYHQELHRRGQLEQAVASRQQPGRFANLELAERSMAKAEEHDEADRLLLHPNPVERRLALKLHGVNDSHLIRAFGDDDPQVQRDALRHPSLGHDGLLGLMQMPDRHDLQLLALHHPSLGRAHLEALYHAHKDAPIAGWGRVLQAIGDHPLLDPALIEKLHAGGHGDATIENRNTPGHILDSLVEAHLAAPDDLRARAKARRALQHPGLSRAVARRAFTDGSPDVKIAAAVGPHLPEDLAQDVLQRGVVPGGHAEPLLRAAIVANPLATERHLATASKDHNGAVRVIAHQRRPQLAKFDLELRGFLGEGLAKATRPEDFKSVARALDPGGAQLVDHRPDLDAAPPEHAGDVQAYRHGVLESPRLVRRASADRGEGITAKAVYAVPKDHPTHAGARFMVKPYHERIIRRIKSWGRHPHQGWAELSNQALYHAAGIGHLHQNVHVAEHDMGPGHEKEPALVVKMEPGWNMVADVPGVRRLSTPETKSDARKVALMDMLTNGLDRHGGNLLHRQTGGGHDMVYGTQPPTDSAILAIDHSRSFQYQNVHAHKNKKRSEQPRQLEDSFRPYVDQSAIGNVDPLYDYTRNNGVTPSPYERKMDSLQRYAPIFDWWSTVSSKVKAAMAQRLTQIKDPEVRDHIARNFNARAKWLDQRAHFGLENYGVDWAEDPIPMYRPGELTEEEQEARDQERQAV